jgi:ABC-type dipeptide/oligopeptide/nickel transport system ATPase component
MNKRYYVDLEDPLIGRIQELVPDAFKGSWLDKDILEVTLGIASPTEPDEQENEEVSEQTDDTSIWLIPWIERRLSQNRNVNMVFVGETGSGKSYSAISLAEQVDPNFSADRIVFTALDFLRLVNSNLPKGSVVLFDDAGLGIPAREWQSTAAKIFGKLVQGFRYKNLISLITVPDLSFIERQSRMLLQLYLESTDVQGLMKPFHPFHPIRGDDRLGFRYPTIQVYGRAAQIRIEKFVMPGKELREAYEAKKLDYMEKTNREFEEELKRAEIKKENRKILDELEILKIQDKVEKYKAKMEKAQKGDPEKERKRKKREKALELLSQGTSAKEVASKTGRSLQWVYNLAKERGVKS